MTKEYIKSMAFETIADMVGNPFEYAADGSKESDAMAAFTIGVVYGVMMLSDSLCVAMDKTQNDCNNCNIEGEDCDLCALGYKRRGESE